MLLLMMVVQMRVFCRIEIETENEAGERRGRERDGVRVQRDSDGWVMGGKKDEQRGSQMH